MEIDIGDYEPLPSELESFPSNDALSAFLTLEAQNPTKGFMDAHYVEAKKRGSLLKWIGEVFEALDLEDASYFKTVDIMDRYFKKTDRVLTNGDLHLVGVSAMRLATAVVEPRNCELQLSNVRDDICYGKFTTEELRDQEADIFVTLGGTLDSPTCLDFLQLYVGRQGMYTEYDSCVRLLKLLQYYTDLPFLPHDQAVAVLLLVPNSYFYF